MELFFLSSRYKFLYIAVVIDNNFKAEIEKKKTFFWLNSICFWYLCRKNTKSLIVICKGTDFYTWLKKLKYP